MFLYGAVVTPETQRSAYFPNLETHWLVRIPHVRNHRPQTDPHMSQVTPLTSRNLPAAGQRAEPTAALAAQLWNAAWNEGAVEGYTPINNQAANLSLRHRTAQNHPITP